jgi:hypothetical protein
MAPSTDAAPCLLAKLLFWAGLTDVSQDTYRRGRWTS